MAAARGLVIHTAILAVAGCLALKTWTYDAEKAPKHGETELWPGNPDQLQAVRIEHTRVLPGLRGGAGD